MWWAFGSGVTLGLLMGLGAAAWLLPRLMALVNRVINTTSLAVKYPTTGEMLQAFTPPATQDPFADLERDEERVPSWMEDPEEESVG